MSHFLWGGERKGERNRQREAERECETCQDYTTRLQQNKYFFYRSFYVTMRNECRENKEKLPRHTAKKSSDRPCQKKIRKPSQKKERNLKRGDTNGCLLQCKLQSGLIKGCTYCQGTIKDVHNVLIKLPYRAQWGNKVRDRETESVSEWM